jgi:hypothetical protein
MAGLFGKWFPALFSNPEEEAFQRKMRINGALRRFDQEIKKQDGYIKQYLQQATVAKRTGDEANYAQVKKMLSFTFACRKRVQRSLHSLQTFSTMSNQMEAYRDFCGAVNDISVSMGNAISVADVLKAQKNLEQGMMAAKSTEELMDQLLASFDTSFAEYVPNDGETAGVKDVDLDNMIAQMAADKDNLTEDRITQVLNGATN